MITGLRLDSYEIHELMNSSGVQRLLEQQAEALNQRAGGGYEVTVQPGVNRAHGRVSTKTKKQYYQELHSNELLRSL